MSASRGQWFGLVFKGIRRARFATIVVSAIIATLITSNQIHRAAAARSDAAIAARESADAKSLAQRLPELTAEQGSLLRRIGAVTVFRPSEGRASPLLRGVVAASERKGASFRSVRTAVKEGKGSTEVRVELTLTGRYRVLEAAIGEIESSMPFARVEKVEVDRGKGDSEMPTARIYVTAPLAKDDEIPATEFAAARRRVDPMESGIKREPPPLAPGMAPVLSGIVWEATSPLAILVDPKTGEAKLMRAGETDHTWKVERVTETEVEVSVSGRKVLLTLGAAKT